MNPASGDLYLRPMKEITDYILNNKEWIFGGIGVVVLGGIIKLILQFFKRRDRQFQVTTGGSTAIQAGRDVNIGGLQPDMTRSIRVRVHRAFLVSNPAQVHYYFINVLNTSNAAEVEVAHVWYEGSRRVDIIQPQRPLPRLLPPNQSWETWVKVTDIPDDPDLFGNFRVRLSTDEVFESEERRNVQGAGFVPGA